MSESRWLQESYIIHTSHICLGITPQLVFYCCAILFPLLELPRYIHMIVDDEYKCSSTWSYCAHLVASGVFFSGYTAIIYMWSGNRI